MRMSQFIQHAFLYREYSIDPSQRAFEPKNTDEICGERGSYSIANFPVLLVRKNCFYGNSQSLRSLKFSISAWTSAPPIASELQHWRFYSQGGSV